VPTPDSAFLAFLAVFALLIVTPGPDTALTVRNTLRGGWRAAWFTAFGVGLGTLAWAAAAVFGITLLLERSPLLYGMFKLAGAAYLAFLGLRSLLTLRRPIDAERAEAPAVAGGSRDTDALRQGLVSNLLNAKTGLFFLTLLPQFIAPGDPPSRLVVMIIAYEVMVIGWLALYGYVVSRAAQRFAPGNIRRWLEAATGVVLVGLALHIVVA